MICLMLFLISIIIGIISNIISLKIIGIVDYDVLGLHNKTISIIKIYKYIFKNKKLIVKIFSSSLIFIILNFIVLLKIFNGFEMSMIHNYLKYYFVFLIIFIFAFTYRITSFVYSVLSYPLTVISLLIFLLSLTRKDGFINSFDNVLLITLFYILIKRLKFLEEGFFDVVLIISLSLGVFPTVFIFCLSLIISIVFLLSIFIKESFKTKNNKIEFLSFIFIATFIFIILKF